MPTLTLASTDAHRGLALAAVAGLLLGSALAVFGLPPVHLHGPLHHLGVMDPFCGLTRGVRHAMRGEVSKAFLYNPASLVLVAGAVALLARSGVGLATGRWLNVGLRPSRRTVAVVLAATAALWVNQQLHADLLR